MRAVWGLVAVSGVALAWRCGHQPTPPSPRASVSTTTTTTAPAALVAAGRVVNGVSDQPIGGATVQIEAIGQATSGPDGAFSLSAAGSPATKSVTATSPETVDRQTWARLPDNALTLSLMPTSVNPTAFDQMFRGNGAALRRWVEAPRLVIQRRLLRFTGTGEASYPALSDLLSDAEVEELRQDLVFALSELTGNTYTAFAGFGVEIADENQMVAPGTAGTIVASRVEGLKTATTFDGYTRWSWNSAGAVRSGFIMLDRGYELSGGRGRRALRAHEMGHALGYNHVTVIPSVMQQLVQTEPNQFDRDASRLAFGRPLLNRSPDADPAPGTASIATDAPGVFWSGAP